MEVFDELAAVVENTPTEETKADDMPVSEGENVLAKYEELYLQNENMAGWISIDGTTVNYPVMQSVNEQNFYWSAVVTNNFQYRDFNYDKLSEPLDVVSYDTYPSRNEPAYVSAFNYDLARSMKEQNPFLIMEMSPNHASWGMCVLVKRLGTKPDQALLDVLLAHYCEEKEVRPIFQTKHGIEATICEKDQKKFLFLLNHNGTEEEIRFDKSYLNLVTREKAERIVLSAMGYAVLEYN